MDSRTSAPAPPPDLLWILVKDQRRFVCQLRSHGTYGWECQFFEGPELIASRRFPMRAQAIDWATAERIEHEAEGWTLRE